MGQVCFGVEPCPDGSVVIASRDRGEVSVTRLAPAPPGSQASQVVALVRCISPAPRASVAYTNGAGAGRGLDLALALGVLPAAEVTLMRPDVLTSSGGPPVAGGKPLAVALATYARRAA
jgi:hypothetical protein